MPLLSGRQLGQDLLRLRARADDEAGRAGAELGQRRAEPAVAPPVVRADVHQQPVVADLGAVGHLGVAPADPGHQAGPVEQLEQLLGGVAHRPPLELADQRGSVPHPVLAPDEPRVGQQLGAVEQLAQRPPVPGQVGGHHHAAVATAQGLVGRAQLRRVADPVRQVPADQVVRERGRLHAQRDVEQHHRVMPAGRVLPSGAGRAPEQRRQHRGDEHEAGRVVHDREAHPHAGTARVPGDLDHPAIGLDDAVHRRTVPPAALGPVAAQREPVQGRVGGEQGGRVKPQPLERARPVVLDHHVGRAQQVARRGGAALVLQVDDHRALADVVGQVRRRHQVWVTGRGEQPGRFAAGRLDLDHVRAELGQVRARGRARHQGGELDHAHACEDALRRRAGLRRAGDGQVQASVRNASPPVPPDPTRSPTGGVAREATVGAPIRLAASCSSAPSRP